MTWFLDVACMFHLYIWMIRDLDGCHIDEGCTRCWSWLACWIWSDLVCLVFPLSSLLESCYCFFVMLKGCKCINESVIVRWHSLCFFDGTGIILIIFWQEGPVLFEFYFHFSRLLLSSVAALYVRKCGLISVNRILFSLQSDRERAGLQEEYVSHFIKYL